MIRTIFDILLYPTQVYMCVVGIVGLRKYFHVNLSLRFLEWYIIASIMIDIVKDVMGYYNIRTLWLSQCFNVIELLLFMLIFYYWRTSRRNGIFMWIAFSIYLVVWVVSKFTFEPLTYSDNYTYAFAQIIQIGFGGWLMLEILQENVLYWKTDPRVWVLSGIVLYATSTFFLFGMFNVMLTLPRHTMLLIWIANLVFLVIQYIFFLRAFLCKPVNAGIIHQSTTIYKE